jgi:DNA polymerase III subunit delta'
MASAEPVAEVFGHAEVRRDLAAAFLREDLPGSLLIHGPPGVGRQTLARWLGRLLVCQEPTPDGPCGVCRDCRLALDLQHPDVHWFFPLPRPKGTSSPDKLAEALETARFEVLAERRANPLYVTSEDDPAGLFLAQVRTIRRLGSTRPAMARRQVFIIGNAELLVPQEASEEAANALLKILEEPPPATTFILTTSDPESLLPTVRSRLLPVRLAALTPDAIATFLQDRAGLDADTARALARLGRGSIHDALALMPGAGGGAPTRAAQIRDTAYRWLEATLDPRPEWAFSAALEQKPVGARGAFADTLAGLALWLRDLAAVAAGASDHVADVGAVERLEARAGAIRLAGIPEAISLVEEARDDGRINANPQLTLAWLLLRIRSLLRG